MDSGLAGTIGLIFFFSVFIGVLFLTFNPKRKEEIEDLKNIPLREDKND